MVRPDRISASRSACLCADAGNQQLRPVCRKHYFSCCYRELAAQASHGKFLRSVRLCTGSSDPLATGPAAGQPSGGADAAPDPAGEDAALLSALLAPAPGPAAPGSSALTAPDAARLSAPAAAAAGGAAPGGGGSAAAGQDTVHRTVSAAPSAGDAACGGQGSAPAGAEAGTDGRGKGRSRGGRGRDGGARGRGRGGQGRGSGGAQGTGALPDAVLRGVRRGFDSCVLAVPGAPRVCQCFIWGSCLVVPCSAMLGVLRTVFFSGVTGKGCDVVGDACRRAPVRAAAAHAAAAGALGQLCRLVPLPAAAGRSYAGNAGTPYIPV